MDWIEKENVEACRPVTPLRPVYVPHDGPTLAASVCRMSGKIFQGISTVPDGTVPVPCRNVRQWSLVFTGSGWIRFREGVENKKSGGFGFVSAGKPVLRGVVVGGFSVW